MALYSGSQRNLNISVAPGHLFLGNNTLPPYSVLLSLLFPHAKQLSDAVSLFLKKNM